MRGLKLQAEAEFLTLSLPKKQEVGHSEGAQLKSRQSRDVPPPPSRVQGSDGFPVPSARSVDAPSPLRQLPGWPTKLLGLQVRN